MSIRTKTQNFFKDACVEFPEFLLYFTFTYKERDKSDALKKFERGVVRFAKGLTFLYGALVATALSGLAIGILLYPFAYTLNITNANYISLSHLLANKYLLTLFGIYVVGLILFIKNKGKLLE